MGISLWWTVKKSRLQRWLTCRRGHGANKRTLEFFSPIVASLTVASLGWVKALSLGLPHARLICLPPQLNPWLLWSRAFCLRVMVCLHEIKTGGGGGGWGGENVFFSARLISSCVCTMPYESSLQKRKCSRRNFGVLSRARQVAGTFLLKELHPA